MNNKLTHSVLVFFDLLGIVILWLGYHSIKNYFFDIDHRAEVIEFSSRAGFFTAGVFMPTIHLIAIIKYFFPEVIKKNVKAFNFGAIFAIFVFLFSSFYISSWMKSNVENVGYVYCRNASGLSVLTKQLVFTQNMNICEELVESKRR